MEPKSRRAAQGKPFSVDPMTRAVFPRRPEHQAGRYAIFDEIAGGGMATVHSPVQFLDSSSGRIFRVVAAKRIHRPFSAGSF